MQRGVKDLPYCNPRYLAGRAWHRGQDPALGPSNISDPVPKL